MSSSSALRPAAPPASLHLDTAANRLVIADDRIVAGPHDGLYRLVGTHISRVLDGEMPVLRKTGPLAHAYLALGARAHPRGEHWHAFFEGIDAN